MEGSRFPDKGCLIRNMHTPWCQQAINYCAKPLRSQGLSVTAAGIIFNSLLRFHLLISSFLAEVALHDPTPISQLACTRHQVHHFYSRQGYVDCRDQKPLKLSEATEAFIMRLLRSPGFWRQKKYIQASCKQWEAQQGRRAEGHRFLSASQWESHRDAGRQLFLFQFCTELLFLDMLTMKPLVFHCLRFVSRQTLAPRLHLSPSVLG